MSEGVKPEGKRHRRATDEEQGPLARVNDLAPLLTLLVQIVELILLVLFELNR